MLGSSFRRQPDGILFTLRKINVSDNVSTCHGFRPSRRLGPGNSSRLSRLPLPRSPVNECNFESHLRTRDVDVRRPDTDTQRNEDARRALPQSGFVLSFHAGPTKDTRRRDRSLTVTYLQTQSTTPLSYPS